jgi:hypothetical protein
MALLFAIYLFIKKQKRWPFIFLIIGFLYSFEAFFMDLLQQRLECIPFKALNGLYIDRIFCMFWGITTLEFNNTFSTMYVGMSIIIAEIIFATITMYGGWVAFKDLSVGGKK